MYCMKPLALLLLSAALLLGACTTAGAASLRAHGAVASLGDPDFGPALDGDYVYWVRDTKHAGHLDSTIYRMAISSGKVKVIDRMGAEEVVALFANGGRVAWSTVADRHSSKDRSWPVVTKVFGMAHSGKKARTIASGRSRYAIKGRGGSARAQICGTTVELLSLSSKQEALYNAESHGCRGHASVSRGEIYNLRNGGRFRVPPLGSALFAVLQAGKLINGSKNDILVTNLASGAVTRYKNLGIPDQAIVNSAGDLVVAGDANSGGRVISRITIFGAGSTTASAVIDEPWLDSPSVLFCAGGVVEISEPNDRVRVALRSLDGRLHEQFTGPRAGLGYDAKCSGTTVKLAAIASKGMPQVFSYEF